MRTLLSLLALIVLAVPAFALTFDQDVTPDVIFGSGNINGSFTLDTQTTATTTVELGLRGKLRFDASNMPQNIFNSNGDGSYNFLAGYPTGGAGWATTTTPYWNFEWSVNVDQDGFGGAVLSDFTYELGMDFDPSPGGTNYLVFDPITPTVSVPGWDHAIGDNGGTVVSDATPLVYAANVSAYNVAQNSWSYEFFNNAPFNTFDPTVDGVYEIYLKAFDAAGNEVAHTAISIVVGNAVGNEDATFSAVKSLYR